MSNYNSIIAQYEQDHKFNASARLDSVDCFTMAKNGWSFTYINKPLSSGAFSNMLMDIANGLFCKGVQFFLSFDNVKKTATIYS